MYINDALRKIRKDNPKIKTQDELADAIGISAPMVSTYLSGISSPNIGNAAKIWGKYQIQVEPFTELALQEEVDRATRIEELLNAT